MSVLIVTSVGDIAVDLHAERCPLASKNFLKLCKMKYYNGCLFHKVEKDFLAQTGDPTGTGTGGDSAYRFIYGEQARFFNDEIHPNLRHKKMGTVAMASAGENCNASQFYFTLRDDLDYLDEKHTVFGIVEEEEGLETLKKINEAFVDAKGRPLKDIRIKHTYILDDPFDDPPGLVDLIPENSPIGKPRDEVAEERLEDSWVPLEDTLRPAELEEKLRSREAHTNAAILEITGDIPDADIKPPENVLFVCKLNPVTEDEDLYTIFSQFGSVTSAEVIRDYKTGDSLCYAFIEFEKKEACEKAYFKMDGTLIDDRRIHVDFSQSVSKMWNQYRRQKSGNAKKGGCFTCGAPDHLARDCDRSRDHDQTRDAGTEGPKYVLKDDENAQRGGTERDSYDLLFDEHDSANDTKRGNQGRSARHKSDRNSEHPRSTTNRNSSDRADSGDEKEGRHGKYRAKEDDTVQRYERDERDGIRESRRHQRRHERDRTDVRERDDRDGTRDSIRDQRRHERDRTDVDRHHRRDEDDRGNMHREWRDSEQRHREVDDHWRTDRHRRDDDGNYRKRKMDDDRRAGGRVTRRDDDGDYRKRKLDDNQRSRREGDEDRRTDDQGQRSRRE